MMPDNLPVPVETTGHAVVKVLSSAVSAIAGFAGKMVLDTFRRSDQRESELLKLAEKLADERRVAEGKFHDSAMVFVGSVNTMTNSIDDLKECIADLSRSMDRMPCAEAARNCKKPPCERE